MHKTHYKNIKITALPHSETEIEGEIEAEELEHARTKAIKKFGEEISVDGFRKGHVPENIVMAKIGEAAIMEEAAEMLLGHEYQHIVVDHKIDVIGRPQITLTKLARGNALGFKIRVPVFPQFNLPDYKKIASTEIKNHAKTTEKIEVGEKEIEDVINEILKSQLKNGSAGKAGGEEKNSAEKENGGKENLPALTDELVKTIGDFKDVADFKNKISENLLREKQSRAEDKKRISLGEKVTAAVTIDLPEILIESELDKMNAQFSADIERMGLKIDDYLKHIKKTAEEMRKEWRKDAEKRVILQVVFNKIALEEKLLPEEKEIEAEAKHLLEHYKDADPNRIRAYVETMLANEKVFRFLESQ